MISDPALSYLHWNFELEISSLSAYALSIARIVTLDIDCKMIAGVNKKNIEAVNEVKQFL